MYSWLYNESKHCDVDYSDVKQAEAYDNQHQKFRNYEKEFAEMLDFIALENVQEKCMIDLGCGTGATAIFAAGHFKKVFAVDISNVMLAQARNKADVASIKNIEFHNAGFLTYEHPASPADVVMTKAAFHHLPDFWKQIALLKMNSMLKPGGILYIFDIVFHFDPADYKGQFESWVAGFEATAGREFRHEVETHLRDEYSTFGWILEGMLKNAGFAMVKSRVSNQFVTEYCCKKVCEVRVAE